MAVKLVKLNITPSERLVMEAVWQLKETPFGPIAELVHKKTRWDEKTIRTLLGRLVARKVVRYRAKGRRYIYRPAIEREQYLLAETVHFMERIGKKNFATLLQLYVAYHRPRRKELLELRSIIQKKLAARKKR